MMKVKVAKIITIIVVTLIIGSFFLPWINSGKLSYTGIEVPSVYEKMVKITNSILFFNKKESPYFAYYIFVVPILAALTAVSILLKRVKVTLVLLLLSSTSALSLSIYMYNYVLNSKIMGVGGGIHLLCVSGFLGIIFSTLLLIFIFKKRAEEIIF